MTSFKDLANSKGRERIQPGHRTCPGCAIPIIARTVLASIKEPVVVVNATGCMEVTSTVYPFTSWNIPFMHNAFENAGATISGIEKALIALKRKGVIKDDIKIIGFGGDGGTYDIGLQSLSGAMERKQDFLYICYDNEGYMNTGDQQSGATPIGARTSTTPVGTKIPGKMLFRKDLTKIVAAHNIPYVAQASIAFLDDFSEKVKKAMTFKGPKFINVLSTCTRYWGIEQNQTVEIAKSAVLTNFWPLFEIENGKRYKINFANPKPLPITDFLSRQKRFSHMFKEQNKHIIAELQAHIDSEWSYLNELAKINVK